MLLGTRKTLFDHITESLLVKPASVADLVLDLKAKNINVTVQGIYKTLRELVSEDIVVKQKKMYLVSNVWREKLTNLVSQRTPFNLSAGEQTTYRFKKLEHLDAFWKHTMADLDAEIIDCPVFGFVPHQYWAYVPGRKQSEDDYYRAFNDRGAHLFTLIGGDTPYEKSFRDEFASPTHQVHLDPHAPFSRRDHISVMGPYIVTTRVSQSVARATDHLFNTSNSEAELIEKLIPVFTKPNTITMIVEYNIHKAKKLRKQMARDFHVPMGLREKFELF